MAKVNRHSGLFRIGGLTCNKTNLYTKHWSESLPVGPAGGDAIAGSMESIIMQYKMQGTTVSNTWKDSLPHAVHARFNQEPCC